MDLRAYLEEDMLAFLDSRLSVDYLKEQSTRPVRVEDGMGMFAKDYEKLLFAALNEHNIPKAKQVLHDVKDEFSSNPPGSPERRQLQALLHVLYQKFKDYLENQNTLTKMEHALDTVDTPDIARKHLSGDFDELAYGRAVAPQNNSSQEQLPHEAQTHELLTALDDESASTDSAESADETHAPQQGKPMDDVLPEEAPSGDLLDPLEQDLLATMHFLDDVLEQREVEQARTYYQQAQRLFARLPETTQQQYYDRMIHYHSTISVLIHQTMVTAPSLSQTEQDLMSSMKAGDLHESMIHYEELRDQVLLLSPQERNEHIPRLQQYHKKILAAWNQWQAQYHDAQPNALEQHEKRLSGKP